jgi:hypothetical protein
MSKAEASHRISELMNHQTMATDVVSSRRQRSQQGGSWAGLLI